MTTQLDTTSVAGPSRTPSQHLLANGRLIKQGAEARIYTLPHLYPAPTTYYPPGTSLRPSGFHSTHGARDSADDVAANEARGEDTVVLKYRFPKGYRHPSLDATLSKTRLSFEARALARCARAGVTVPKILWVDEVGGVLGMERVRGWSIREVLGGGAEEEGMVEDEAEGETCDSTAGALEEEETEGMSEGMAALRKLGVTQEHLMASIGTALAKLHLTNIIHGDLTTSNCLLRLTPGRPDPYEIVLIDFGLSSTAQFPEHFAVDLYVLERAFASTHPQSEVLYAGVLKAYEKGLGEKKWRPIEIKLREVRLRGRKRDMTG